MEKNDLQENTLKKFIVTICYSSDDANWVADDNPIDRATSFVHKMKKQLQQIFDFYEMPITENLVTVNTDYKTVIENTDIVLLLITDNFSESYIVDIFLPFLKAQNDKKKITIYPIMASSLSKPSFEKLKDLFETYNVLPDNLNDLSSLYLSDKDKGDLTVIRIINGLFEKGNSLRKETDLYYQLKKERNIELAQKYLESYKNRGLFVEEVHEMLANLSSLRKEEEDFKDVIRQNSKNALNGFIIKYPKSKYRLQILTAIEKLDEAYKDEAKAAYEKLDKKDVHAMYGFLEKYPFVSQSKQVKTYIREVEQAAYKEFRESDDIHIVRKCSELLARTKYREKVLEKIRRLDNKAYNKALKIDTIASYTEYLTLYPDGDYREKVQKKIKSEKKRKLFMKNWKWSVPLSLGLLLAGAYFFYRWILVTNLFLVSYHSPLPGTIPFEIGYDKMEKIYNTPFYIYQHNEIDKEVPLEDTLVWKGIGFAEKGDRENAKKVFENATYSPVAMFNLAVLCNNEREGSGDEWMAMAAKLGYPAAEYYVLLKPYQNMGNSISPSESEMSKLRLKLHKLADKQYPLANAVLGNLYYLMKDEKQAIENYEIAAKAGIENSIDNLIRLYNQNNEKRKAYTIAEQFFNAKDNNYTASNIKDFLIAVNYYGVGCEKNPSKAFSMLKEVCENDSYYNKRQWHINLAMMYYNGDG